MAWDSGDIFTLCEIKDGTETDAWLCVMKMKLSVTCNKSIYRQNYSILSTFVIWCQRCYI